MKQVISYFPILLTLLILSSCKSKGELTSSSVYDVKAEEVSIIPKPSEITWGDSHFNLPSVNLICYNPQAEESSEWLKQLLIKANLKAESTRGNGCGIWNLIADGSLKGELGEEGYILEINNDGILLKAATNAGLFYAVQTLRQMLPASIETGEFRSNRIRLPHVYIKDKPAYSWRGNMVDVARSFFGIDYLKRHVDRMALYKLNRLHLHLTDDQGWRIEIKGKPLLTEVGSKGSVKGGRSGYISQEEYKELQVYAAARNIVIIPEIDMPGHIYSALVAYPELNCPENANITPALAIPPQLYDGYEVGWSKLCLEKPEIYDFVSEVIGEISAITKGPWIHIGGDEIHDPLYETFVVKADSIVQTYGKTSIGWEEVTKASVSSSLISQKWNGKTEGIVDVKVIESICSNFYLDHANVPGQKNTLNWCKEDGVSLENVYSFKSNDPNVLGVEAAVWTEHVLNEDMMDDRFWPRTIAVAEVGWTAQDTRNFDNFKERLARHGTRLKKMGIHFFPTPEIDWGPGKVSAKPHSIYSEFIPGDKNF